MKTAFLPPLPRVCQVRMTIVNSGGIDPLMELMWGGAPYTKAHATAALGSVATSNAATQEVILKRGGVALLVSILRDGVPTARDAAAVALRNLTTGARSHVAPSRATMGKHPPHSSQYLTFHPITFASTHSPQGASPAKRSSSKPRA